MRLSSRVVVLGALVVILTAVPLVFRQQILWQLGALLTDEGPPEKADAIVVLGGDWTGRRILKAAELAREGYAPKVLVSGARGFFGQHESYYSIDYAVHQGYSPALFVPVTFAALATVDEASNDVSEMRKLGVHKFLLVTSPWHTARAVRIFRHAAPDLQVRGIGCEDPHWHNGYWWNDREGEKIWFSETQKTVANAFGI